MTTKLQEKPKVTKVKVTKKEKPKVKTTVEKQKAKPKVEIEPKVKTLSISDYPKFIEENYYAPVKSFLGKDLCAYLYQTLLMKIQRGQFTTDQQSPDQPAWGGSTMLDSLLLTQQQRVEELVGYALYPTYSYARVYSPGAILKPHKDRPSCEVSVTCTLGFAGEPSPLYFVKDKMKDDLPAGEFDEEHVKARWAGKPTKLTLTEAGDAAVYLGPKIIHWRQEQPSERLAQVFLHYVRRDGQNNSQKYDGRDPSAFLRGPLDEASVVLHK
jgi:hypothetical protein